MYRPRLRYHMISTTRIVGEYMSKRGLSNQDKIKIFSQYKGIRGELRVLSKEYDVVPRTIRRVIRDHPLRYSPTAKSNCLICDKICHKGNQKYCSRDCYTKHRWSQDYLRRGTSSQNRYCLLCREPRGRRNKKYCSQSCHKKQQWLERKLHFEETGLWPGVNNETSFRQHTKRYLIEKLGHQCSICKLTEWNSEPIPLIMDHIDGHSENNNIENCRLVCGNCDMQLPTYKSKNIGNGRAYRRQRYAEGKSY